MAIRREDDGPQRKQGRTYANSASLRAVCDAKPKRQTPVAIYHLSVKTVSRSAGRSATAAAAYRAGVEIADERTGEIHDYTRKGGVESADLILPENAPEWAADRARLWNAAEQAEKRKNSTVVREFEIALPSELSPKERQRLAHDLAREIVERHGCAVDVAIHAPGKEGDDRNHHAHILCSTRRLGPEGFGEKTRELDDKATGSKIVTEWRERFASLQNERLREAGEVARVDHRSLADQGIERMPTVHLGPAATAIERRTGGPSEKRQSFQERIEAAAQRLRERLARAAAIVAPDLVASAGRFHERWEAAKAEKVRQQKAEQERIAKEKQARAEAEKEQQRRSELGREFRDMATRRAMQASGYRDSSDEWKATPKLLREIIDDYNKQPKEAQERALSVWVRDPEKSKAIAIMIEQRRENVRHNDLGMSI